MSLIILLGVFLRLTFLRYNALVEADDYYYLGTLLQSHGFALPSISSLNGAVPQESYGLYMPALLLHFIGLSFYNAILISAPIFFVIESILVFLFAKELINDNKFALITTLIFSLVLPNLVKTLAGNYRGDSFISVFLLASLLCLTYAAKSKSKLGWLLASLSAVAALAIGVKIWSGGVFIMPIILGTLIMGILLSLGKNTRKVAIRLAGTLAIMLIFGLIAFFLLHQTKGLDLITNPLGGFNAQGGSQVSGGISELQHPTGLDLLGAYNIYMISPAIALFIYSGAVGGIVSWLIISITVIIFYLIMLAVVNQREDNEKILLLPLIGLIIWFLVTGYFNGQYIRYEGLASIPISLLFSLGIWSLANNKFVKHFKIDIMIYSFVILVAAFFALLYIANVSPQPDINPGFISALNWLNANTMNSSRIWTLWDSGSVVEGQAQRFSYSDSLPGINNVNTTNWFFGNGSQELPNTSAPLYLLDRYYFINQSYAYCQTVTDGNWLNCGNLEKNGTVNESYLELKQPAFWQLLNTCNYTGCTFVLSGRQLELVYENNDSKIYQVG